VYAGAVISHIYLERLRAVAALVLLGLAGHSAGAAEPDGPYILRGANGGWEAVSVEVTAAGARKKAQPLGANAAVTIPAVGKAPSFQVKLREPAADVAAQISAPANAPLLVVADTHGEYETLVATLRAHKVVDGQLKWKFARGHLVVLGDVFDRGPNHLEIFWLLYKLETEAARAGGGVDLVLGNHETMVLRGDLRYLHAKYAETAALLGQTSYSELFDKDTLLGQWLRSKAAMIKVNEYLCLHAGVSRALVDSRLSLAEVNATVRDVLNGEDEGAVAELVMGNFGPLWYRGYFPGQDRFPTAPSGDVDMALATFGARRMLVGHTIVDTITPLYDGKVVAVQARPFAGLLIRKGEFWQAAPDGSVRRVAVR
jgi:hypothetical protein